MRVIQGIFGKGPTETEWQTVKNPEKLPGFNPDELRGKRFVVVQVKDDFYVRDMKKQKFVYDTKNVTDALNYAYYNNNLESSAEANNARKDSSFWKKDVLNSVLPVLAGSILGPVLAYYVPKLFHLPQGEIDTYRGRR